MTSQDIAHRRLFSQQIAGKDFTEPAELVRWMGCIRAEDHAGAKWAVGSRVTGSTEKDIEQALHQGRILRTHVLQPAWHFISPEDIRWMLALTAPPLKAFNKEIYHALGIDPAVLRKSKRVIARALEDGQMTRSQLWEVLKKEHIHVDDLRMGWLLMDAELDGLICSGRMEGRQPAYVLLDQRAPPIKQREKEENIAELARRYFLSRGPATIRDFMGWSGLRPADVRTGMELNKQWLTSEVFNGEVYWFDASGASINRNDSLFLLPALDEWAIAYAGNSLFKPVVIIDGQTGGTWTHVKGKGTVTVEVVTPLRRDRVLQAAIRREAERYSLFLGKKLRWDGQEHL